MWHLFYTCRSELKARVSLTMKLTVAAFAFQVALALVSVILLAPFFFRLLIFARPFVRTSNSSHLLFTF